MPFDPLSRMVPRAIFTGGNDVRLCRGGDELFPAMLRAGYNIQVSAGAVTAGGCLGILIPPSVLLIVYGATAGVSVVQLYAGAFFPGLMLAALYVGYVIVLAKVKPNLMPPLPEAAWHKGMASDAEYLPHFCNPTLGRILREACGKFSDTRLTVLCGHTHGEGVYREGNMTVLTGGAEYCEPKVDRVIEVG